MSCPNPQYFLIADASTSASSLYATESGASSSIASLSNAVSQQLSRIRRDLLGLPPLLRKRKADAMEHDTSVADVEMADADGATAQPDAADSTVLQSIDKKERKRLKKERRKEETREKEAAKTK